MNSVHYLLSEIKAPDLLYIDIFYDIWDKFADDFDESDGRNLWNLVSDEMLDAVY